jgi:hypothetical protein
VQEHTASPSRCFPHGREPQGPGTGFLPPPGALCCLDKPPGPSCTLGMAATCRPFTLSNNCANLPVDLERRFPCAAGTPGHQ